MTQQQMLETVRQHHPELGETQIRLWFNQAIDEFCRRTKCIKSAFTFRTTADKRWYGLPDDVLEVESVDFDGYTIPRLSGRPEKRDIV